MVLPTAWGQHCWAQHHWLAFLRWNMCVSSTKFPSQIDGVVFSKVSDMMLLLLGQGASCHSTSKDIVVTGSSSLYSHWPCSRSYCMATTGIELVNSSALFQLTQSQAQLGKSSICASTVVMPGRCCAAQEQVNTCAEIPAMHTIGSERCQLWKM